MRGPRTLLLLAGACAVCVSRSTAVIQVFGFEGSDVIVACPYGAGYQPYEKYFCQKECGQDDDVLITTAQTTKGRFSIFDDKNDRKFMVTISRVTLEDAGKFWCGVTRTGTDLYTEVKLRVTQDSCCSHEVTLQGHEDDLVSVTCPYAVKDQSKVKFLCRGNRPSTCLQRAVVRSDVALGGRFTLADDQTARKFTVTIGGLRLDDSGPYLCGVQSNTGPQDFSAVHLEVKVWCCVRSTEVTGAEGEAVTLQCPYPTSHRQNRKFLCKGDFRGNCSDVVTNGSRFMLQNNMAASSFSVTVLKLEAGDGGTYWCGSDSQWKVGRYTKIVLSVVLQQDAHAPAHNDTSPALKDQPVQVPPLHIGVGVVAMAIILSAALPLVLWRLKRHKQRAAKVLVITGVPTSTGGEDETRREIKQSSCYHDDDDEDQPDYENLAVTEEIYCNHDVIRANVR